MFLELGIILIILWALGLVYFPLGGLINVLLVLAVISIIFNFISGGNID